MDESVQLERNTYDDFTKLKAENAKLKKHRARLAWALLLVPAAYVSGLMSGQAASQQEPQQTQEQQALQAQPSVELPQQPREQHPLGQQHQFSPKRWREQNLYKDDGH